MDRINPLICNIFTCFAVLALVACGKDSPTRPQPSEPPPPTPVAARVAVTPANLAFEALGQNQTLTAVVHDQNGQIMTGAVVIWASSNAGVATVSSQGSVASVGIGTAVITARSGGASATVNVTVSQQVDAVKLTAPAATMVTGDTLRLTAEVTDSGGSVVSGVEISWSSSDESVATVDGEGSVLAVGEGTVEVTATAGSVTGRVQIEVGPPSATVLSITPPTATLSAFGERVQLSADVRDQRDRPMAGVEIKWLSDDPEVASVDDSGLVTAVGNGTVRITAEAGDASGTLTVTVKQVVRFLSISPREPVIASRDTLRLTAEATDSGGSVVSGVAISWSSSEETVAFVDGTGLVWGLSDGTTTIKAATGTISGEVSLKVENPDRAALVEMYYALGGPSWTNDWGWLSDEPLDAWHGVRTDAYSRVTELDLRNNELQGEVPLAIVRLTRLESLLLEQNRLRGPIPTELTQLSELQILHLGFNQLSGSIPPELADLARLHSLSLTSNRLTGEIPKELGRLDQLFHLSLNSNRLSGTVPGELGSLPNLTEFSISGNRLTGPIPSEFVHLTRLISFSFNDNRLTGPIPSWIGQLTNLVGISLTGNELVGRVPPELGDLTGLQYLYLGNNRLSGALPRTLIGLTDLQNLSLSGTDLCAPADAEFQAWLRTVEDRSGVVNCTALENP